MANRDSKTETYVSHSKSFRTVAWKRRMAALSKSEDDSEVIRKVSGLADDLASVK